MASLLLRRGGCAAAAILLSSLPFAAHARNAEPTAEAVAMLSAGDFVWNAAHTIPAKPAAMRIVISIADQKLYLYQGATLLAVSAVSTGKPGHDTPTGDFKILQKQVDHKSSLYDDAPMPYMQRLTWDGVAIHAGRDPGFADSHGCVRVPLAFAKKLFAVTRIGARVSVVDESLATEPDPQMPDDPLALGLEAPAPEDISALQP
ncbi:L,D-transpeptidase family protein [Sphingomonas immobilis]|uniref:L,D-transpeptidase family protein n=1 Tax=Sphingomonas immobilis TaxID=3063997 RepID=A0ABT8ZTF6_9SPHN|nr:L,D-transpeptidase family protein [Sphingomonas sp. CA1-15]MDO7840841.1 L,D-transpeptidase family protein [Sphingomonas sp. CA1-15]